MLRRLRPLRTSHAFLLLGLLACGDAARLPTGPGQGGNLPHLAPGDRLVVLAEREASSVRKCTDLEEQEATTLRIGDPAFLCVPVGPSEDGIISVVVRGRQSQWDAAKGRNIWVEVFEAVDLTEDVTAPIHDGFLSIPRLEPKSNQQTGPVHFEVEISTEEATDIFRTELSGTFLRSVPGVSITSPDAGSQFPAGSTIIAESHISNEEGVSEVTALWSGAVSHTESILLADAPSDTTLKHTLFIPETAEPGELILEVTAVDTMGVASLKATRTFAVTPLPVDSLAPVIANVAGFGGTRVAGDTIFVTATDTSGVAMVGYVITSPDLSEILFADSVEVSGDTAEVAFALNFPTGFPFGPASIVTFAVDELGNRGWAANTPNEPGVAAMEDARPQPFTAAMGQYLRYADNATKRINDLRDIAVHEGRGEIFVSNSALNRIERIDVQSVRFLAPITVGAGASSLAFLPDRNGDATTSLLVARSQANEIALVNIASGSVSQTLKVPDLRIHALRVIDGTRTDTIRYPVTNRPHAIAAACADFSCSGHRIFMANETGGSISYSVVRSMEYTGGVLGTAEVVAPPADESMRAKEDTTTAATLEVFEVQPNGEPVLVSAESNRLLTTTIHNGIEPLLGTAATGTGLFIGQGASIDGTHPRIIAVEPANNWDGIAVHASEHSEVPQDQPSQMDVNSDGSMIALVMGQSVIVVDAELNSSSSFGGTSGHMAPKDIAFLSGHTAGMTPQSGGLLAVTRAGAEPYVDIYETQTFQIVASLPVKAAIQGHLVFFRTAGSDGVAIAGRTSDGFVIVKTTISEILEIGARQ